MKYLKPVTLFQELLKSQAHSSCRLLGLDVGDKYVGLAVSDINNRIASPLSVLIRKKTNIDLMASDFQLLERAMLWMEAKTVLSPFSTEMFFGLMESEILTLQISQFSLSGFIVGYPFDRQQRRTRDAVQVKLFIDDLCNTGKLEDVKYTFWDESFTSKNVEFLLKPLKLHPVLYKTIMDKFAAVGILQGYLDFVNRNDKLKGN